MYEIENDLNLLFNQILLICLSVAQKCQAIFDTLKFWG